MQVTLLVCGAVVTSTAAPLWLVRWPYNPGPTRPGCGSPARRRSSLARGHAADTPESSTGEDSSPRIVAQGSIRD